MHAHPHTGRHARSLALVGALHVVLTAAVGSGSAHAGDVSYIIRGTAMGVYHQHIDVWDDTYAAIEDAGVTVNGIVIPHAGGARYSGTLDAALVPGDPVELVVEIGASTVTATDVVPNTAVITVPSDGQLIPFEEPLVVEWTCENDPDRFIISPYPCDGNCNTDVDGALRSAVIPTDQFPADEPVQIRIYSYNDGTYDGPAHESCAMALRYWQGPGPFVSVDPETPATRTSWTSVKARHRDGE